MSKITDKDKKVWKNFINNEDLHGFTLDEANKEITQFVEKCYQEGVGKINVITGKGSRSKNKEDPFKSANFAILKYSVPDFIKNNSELMKKISKIDFDSVNSPLEGSFNIILKKIIK